MTDKLLQTAPLIADPVSPLCIAVTGGTGFVGRCVVQNLLDAGHCVQALVRPQSMVKTENLYNRFSANYFLKFGRLLPANRLHWIQGGLNDRQAATNLCKNADMVLHMAGLITANTRDEYVAANGEAVLVLAKAARENGVKRFIYLSSLTAREPDLSDYGYSKHVGEIALEQVCNSNGYGGEMQSVCVRAPAVFGAEDVATAPIFSCVRKGFLPAPGGRNWRSRVIGLVHVDDLASYLTGPCLAETTDLESGGTITTITTITTIATQARLTWPEFAEFCTLALGHTVRVLPLPLSLLYPVAAMTSLTKRLFGKGHLTLGKLKEFLHDDWAVSPCDQSGSDFLAAIVRTVYPDRP